MDRQWRAAFGTDGLRREEKLMLGRRASVVLIACVFGMLATAPGSAGPEDPAQPKGGWTETFEVERERFRPYGRNPYFVLIPGHYQVLEEEGGREKVIVTVLDETEIVDGVETRVVEECELEDGELVEISRNFMAIDTLTNSVFYFGEDVDIYKDGKVVSHEGAWRSGEDGARFGLMMPGIVLLGSRYYQEIAPGKAMDRAAILSMAETVKTPAGEFSHCLEIEETNPLEPGEKESNFYAPGIGIVQDESAKLVEYGFLEE